MMDEARRKEWQGLLDYIPGSDDILTADGDDLHMTVSEMRGIFDALDAAESRLASQDARIQELEAEREEIRQIGATGLEDAATEMFALRHRVQELEAHVGRLWEPLELMLDFYNMPTPEFVAKYDAGVTTRQLGDAARAVLSSIPTESVKGR